MGKLTIQEIAKILVTKNGLEQREANRFATELFAIIQECLEKNDLVKVKGLGTWKVITVEARESISVRTGGRVMIDEHSKITFTPDAMMKELVNKPFSQFETVVLNDNVQFADLKEEQATDTEFDDIKEDTEFEDVKKETEFEDVKEDTEFEDVQKDTEFEELSDDLTEEELKELALLEQQEQLQQQMQEVVAQDEVKEPIVELETPIMPPLIDFPEEKPVEAVPEEKPTEVVPEEKPTEAVPVEEPEEVVPEEEPEEVAPEENPVVDENEEEEPTEEEPSEEDKSHSWGKWLGMALAAICLMGISAVGGFYYGSQHMSSPLLSDTVYVRDTIYVPEVQDTAGVEIPAELSVEQVEAKVETPKKEEPKTETPKTETPKAETAKSEKPKTEPVVDDDKYAQKDERVRLGAYRIVGLDREVKVLEGQTFYSICRAHLGPDMECYIEVYNDLPRNPQVKAGQVIKIPKLQLKKRKKQ